MNFGSIYVGRGTIMLAALLGLSAMLRAGGDAAPAGLTSQNDQIAVLKAALEAQQKQLEALRTTMEQQQKLLEEAMNGGAQAAQRPNPGNAASISPRAPAEAGGNPCEAGSEDNTVPPYLRLGSVCIVPVGFLDATTVWRDKNAGSSMGSNFGSIPYNNTVNGNLSEFRFSPQNSRLGLRVDGDWRGAHFIGYNEFDFNGTSGSNGITVSNGAFVPRLRLFWVDVRKGPIEFLAGQSWSMLTPNRKGISPLPADLFYTQAIDINYTAGLTWTRQPGMRVLYHPNEKVTFGVSAEQPDQYIGGSAGGSGITLPTALTGLSGTQLDAANETLAAPTVAPDIIAKVAFDPSARFHFEVAGVERTFKTVNPSLLSQHFTATGGGVLVGGNLEVVKGIRLITTNFWSDGGGRYLFGQAPDTIVRADGSLSLVHAGGTVDGIEATVKNTLLYGYYGGVYIGRDAAFDADGKSLIGYGYTGSPNSQNRAINEVTFGFNHTMWKNPRYGAINFMGQYEWLQRNPWFVALGSPKATHDSTIYFNFRYTLPGSMPNF